MKKRLAILISVSLWASAMLAGCGNNNDSTDGGAAAVEDSAPAVEETAQADGEENTAGGVTAIILSSGLSQNLMPSISDG